MRDRNPQKHGLEESYTFITFPSCYVNRGGLCITNVLQTRKKQQNVSSVFSILTALSNTGYVGGKRNICSKRPSSYL